MYHYIPSFSLGTPDVFVGGVGVWVFSYVLYSTAFGFKPLFGFNHLNAIYFPLYTPVLSDFRVIHINTWAE